MNKPVCLILGAGAGMGGHVAKRFAREGHHACLARRSDKAGLDQLVAEIEAEGRSATGFMRNAVEGASIEQLVQHIEADIGPIGVAVFNLGAPIGDLGLRHTAQGAWPGALYLAARTTGAGARRPADAGRGGQHLLLPGEPAALGQALRAGPARPCRPGLVKPCPQP